MIQQRDVSADGPPFRIDANGVWWHGDMRVQRIELVKLFASIMQRLDDGSYWIINPAERCHVSVEDVPYIIESCTQKGDVILCVTNLGEQVIIGPTHTLTMRGGKPYVMVRGNCEARVATQVYYQLVEMAQQRGTELFITSQGVEFSLGHAA